MKCSLMSLKSSFSAMSIALTPSMFISLPSALYESSNRTKLRFLFATAKCKGVFPKLSF